jgi:hypothetical protein
MSLPSEGKFYTSAVVDIPPNGELPVYPMTSIDEITIKSPDALFNGAALVDVIKSCIPNIKDPWQLNSIDIEAIIVAIRAASIDGTIDITSTCPSCEHQETFGVDLVRLLGEKRDIDYTSTLKIHDLEIKFKPLTYVETNKNNIQQFGIQRKIAMADMIESKEEQGKLITEGIAELNKLTMDILADTVEYIKTPETMVNNKDYIKEFLESTDSKTSKAIREYSIDLRQKNDTKPLKMKCSECGNEYNQSLILNFTDFFA